MGFKDIVHKKVLRFEDRNSIIEDIKTYYQNMMIEKPYFKIISIHGMGGIGKSRLLNELKTILKQTYGNDTNQTMLHLSLEITGSDYFLNALVNLRSQINEICPLFDYAFLIYWKQTQISKLDESFMNTFKSQWNEALKWLGSMFSIPMHTATLSIDTIMDILEKKFVFFKEKYYSSYFQKHVRNISEYSASELKECLSGFLGMDINRIYCEKNLCIFIDSYERYPSSNYVDWLMDMMEQANTGLFVIFGREKISFPEEIVQYVIHKSLDELPFESVQILLIENIPDIDNKTIQHIYKVTEGLPIYIDLAISTYQCMLINDKVTDKIFMYKNKEDVIKQFFSHLKPAHQEFLLALSFFQIFDIQIFSYILKLFPGPSILDYNDIQFLSIVSNVENDNSFYKVHDVLNTNVIEVINIETRLFLFHKYLEYIVSETILYSTDIQKVLLYKHIINMIIKNEFILQKEDTELLLDLFFSLKQTLHTILPTGISGMDSYEPLKDVYYFTMAITAERENTLKRLEYLQHINFEHNMFGKHNKSLKIIYGFLVQWTGNNQPLVTYLKSAYPLLNDTDIREWYYAQTVIFWADHLTINGDFKKAQKVLCTFKNKLKNFPEQENSIFQTTRHIGHIFRFNMFLQDADYEYCSVMDENEHFKNDIQKIYIVTNICETNCYLNPEKVFNNCYKGLKLGKKLSDLKSLAKIYYSMGISCIHKRKYKRAQKYIRKSMYLDFMDGYELGILSSMLANIYLGYSLGKAINCQSFKNLLAKVNVYGFQLLPLAIINNDITQIESIGTQYEWIDYKQTIEVYKIFFTSIHP